MDNFLPDDAEFIISIPLRSHNVHDKLVWHYAKDEIFSVRTGYCIAKEFLEENEKKIMDLGPCFS